MSAFLVHVRSAISVQHIESDFSRFEGHLPPGAHYLLSREGRTANYVLIWEESLSELSEMLRKACSNFQVDQLSIVELGSIWAVSEQGVAQPDNDECGGELCTVWNPETFEPEYRRFRTGLSPWLRRRVRFARDLPGQPMAIFVLLREPLRPGSPWLEGLKGTLGKSARAHMKDEKSLLISWNGGVSPRSLVNKNPSGSYLRARFIHTAFCFSLGPREWHTAGDLQSVLPPMYARRAARRAQAPVPPSLKIAHSASGTSDRASLVAAIARLKARGSGKRSR